MPIEWNKDYELDIKEIDDQHKTFVDIIKELHKTIYELKAEETIGEIFNKLEGFAEFHFATEEKYFKEFKYKESKEHIKLHNEFKKEINNFKLNLKTNKLDVSTKLAEYLIDWLAEHLIVADKKYVKLFKEHGL